MQKRRGLIGVAIACALGIVTALSMAAAPRSDLIPVDKQQEIAGTVEERSEDFAEEIRPVPEVLASFPDVGDPTDVDDVRQVIADLLTDSVAPGRLDARSHTGAVLPSKLSAEKRRANELFNLSKEAQERRREILEQVYSSGTLIQQDLIAFEKGIGEVLTDDSLADLAYFDNRFLVESTDGVRVDGDTAFVILNGAQRYEMSDGRTHVDGPAQYQVELVRAPTHKYGWLIVERIYIDLAGQG